MSNHVEADIWIIGAGQMAIEYTRVLAALGRRPVVIGRGEAAVERFTTATGRTARSGGVTKFLATRPPRPTAAVVATDVASLAEVTGVLIDGGVRRILVEKPAALDGTALAGLAQRASAVGAEVRIAYNRRYYASTRRARQIIAEDGGVTSFVFEFTEWSHEIVGLPIAEPVKRRWLVANSSHVIDLAFHLGGDPAELDCRIQGALSWHPVGAVFAGAGRTESNALFSYHANWAGPGRWGVELVTAKRRLILRPLEKLQIVRLGTVKVDEEPIDDEIDRTFKPGLYRQLEAFLGGDCILPTLDEQRRRFRVYDRMSGERADER